MTREVRYPGLQRGGVLLGEDNGQALMTNAEAKAARELRHDFGMTMQELASMYGTSRAAMSYLLRGKTYKHVGGPLDPGRRPPGSGRANPNRSHKAILKAC